MATPTIEDLAVQPVKVQTSAGSVENQKLPDLIAADQYLAQKRAAGKNPLSGMRRGRLRLPGPIGSSGGGENV